MPEINFINKNIISYKDAFELQTKIQTEKIRQKTNKQEITNDIIWCQHPHVYTIGKSGDQNNLLISEAFLKKINAEYFQTNRGGDITYHGPGQLVCYPIIDLHQFNIGVKKYIEILEKSVIEFVAEYGIKGQINDSAAGVWIDTNTPNERKICAIGVKISQGITMHGFALNLTTNLDYFNHINPCGFTNKKATSVKKETNLDVSIDEAIAKLQEIIPRRLNNF